MPREPSPKAIRYEVYPEDLRDASSHIVSCTSNRNDIRHRITAFADGDPFSVDLHALMEAVSHHRTPAKLAELSQVTRRYRGLASSLKEEDARLQEDIMDMMVRLAQVRSDIVEAEERLDMACNALSPIRLLPAEILEIIFLAVVKGRDTEEWYPPRSSPQTALSQVSSNWRHISLELPHLWNRFLFKIGVPSRNNKHPLQRTLAYLDLWLKRSHPLPFAVCLEASAHFPHDSDGPYYHTILQAIASRAASRIEVLRVHIDSHMLLASTSWSQLASVKRLELCHSGSSSDLPDQITLPCRAFEQLSSLTSFHHDVNPSSPFHFPVPLANLTEMEVGENNEGIDAYTLNYLLRCCPKLKHGRFCLAGAGRWDGFNFFSNYVPQSVLISISLHDRFSLGELKSLALNGQDFLLQMVLQNLETPKLETLELRFRSTVVNNTIMESWRQTFQSLRSLRTFSLSCGSIEKLDDLVQCLELLHNLQHLKYQAHCDSKLFRLLTVKEDAAHIPLLPGLRRLSTWVWGMKDGERKDFWDMYHSRRKQVRRLTSVVGSVSVESEFVIDAFVDSTKFYSADVPDTLQAENPSAKHTIRFHIVSPFTRM